MDSVVRRAAHPNLVALLLISLLSAGLVSLNMHAHPKLSIFDEMVHFDYMYKLAHGHLVVRGERVGQVAMREESCRGLAVQGFVAPPCQAPFNALVYPQTGYNTAVAHPPLYYLITGLGARFLVEVHLIRDPLGAARAFGAVWLAAGLFLIWVIAGRLGASLLARTLTVLLAMSSGLLIHMSSTVNPDASALVAGGIVLLAVLEWERSRRWILLPVAVAISILLKETHSFASVAVLLYLGFRWWCFRADSNRKTAYLAAIGLVAITAAVVEVGWLEVVRLRSIPGVVFPMDRQLAAASLPILSILSPAPTFLQAVGGATDIPPFRVDASALAGSLSTFALVGGCVAAVLHGQGPHPVRWLGTATLIALAISGPLLTVETLLLSHAYIGGIPSRFSMSLWPLAYVLLAAQVKSRSAHVMLGVLVCFTLLLTLSDLTGHASWERLSI